MIINLCLVTLISYYSVHIGLSLFSASPRQTHTVKSTAMTTAINSPSRYQLNVQPIINAHLFGQVIAKQTQNNPENKPLPNQEMPETKLKINLQGIYYSDSPNESFVIIDDKKIGLHATIQAGVTLYQILPKQIVLKRNNRFESLKLREIELLNSQPVEANNTPSPEGLLASYQRQLKTNPQALMKLARIQPAYDNGQFIGYLLHAGQDKSLLSQFNLQAGDILTTVNNVELDSPLKGLSLIQQLSEAEQLDLTILRNGRVHSQSFNIKN